MELWLLTKIAMLFFIISLSLIAINVSNTEKSALCGEQALATAKIIASNVNQVLAAPVEDARVVYKFEPTIAVSRERFGERYEAWLAQRVATDKVQLSIVVNPLGDKTCRRRVSLFLDPDKVEPLEFYNDGAPAALATDVSIGEEVFKLTPSERDVDQRTRFLVIVKCKVKTIGGKNVIHFDNCRRDQPGECSSFASFPECE